ncbi:MAG: serine/threonine protein phosphatase [Oscillospiraceae bacterium]|nr:serine/threonine protein phosphatase [Oscillospiraceae bacterium]
MIYAISDLHGSYEKYVKMLEKINLGVDDTLYVLGDVIDRESGGIDILLDMMQRPNIKPIIGNHESLALGPMKSITFSSITATALQNTKAYKLWMLNDGESTEKAFRSLDNETQIKIINYIESFSIYEEITVGEQKFHLSHTLPDYNPNKPIHDVSYLEFIYGQTDYGKIYANDTLFVTGHTPTMLIDPAYKGRIYKKNNHIAIDCGAVFGGRLGCLCLDTMKEFYI